MDADKVRGFTRAERLWILAAYGNQCAFHYFDGFIWKRCNRVEKLQVHHVKPRGWLTFNDPAWEGANSWENGIPICEMHHIGKGARSLKFRYIIHPDTVTAMRAYGAGDSQAFMKMMERRAVLVREGKVYWNDLWDEMFLEQIEHFARRFLRRNPYPIRRTT